MPSRFLAALAALVAFLGLGMALAIGSANVGWAAEAAPLATKGRPTPQATTKGGVAVTVTPRGALAGEGTWDFEVVLETHGQDLGDELERSAALIGADGKPYSPVGWEGSPPGGHHRKGLLRFQAPSPLPSTVELRIKRAGETDPRVFRWRLEDR